MKIFKRIKNLIKGENKLRPKNINFIDITNKNLWYLQDIGYNLSEINKIIESAPFPNQFIYDFNEVAGSWGSWGSVKFKYRTYNDTIKQYIYIYELDDIEGYGCVSQVFDIPEENNELNTRLAIGLSYDVFKDDCKLKYTLGHEIAHIDLFHLPEYTNHPYQMRYSLIEAYCDVKAIESIEDREEQVKAFRYIKDYLLSLTDGAYDTRRENEIRFACVRLYLKGKLTSKMLYDYIITHYEQHMQLLDRNMEKWLELDELDSVYRKAIYKSKGWRYRELYHRMKDKIYRGYYI